jgi:hypothetical protein
MPPKPPNQYALYLRAVAGRSGTSSFDAKMLREAAIIIDEGQQSGDSALNYREDKIDMTLPDSYDQREMRIKDAEMGKVAYAMLGPRGEDEAGRMAFDSLDDKAKAYWLSVAKKAWDHFLATYYDDQSYKTQKLKNVHMEQER